jgi:hypothetical protein
MLSDDEALQGAVFPSTATITRLNTGHRIRITMDQMLP